MLDKAKIARGGAAQKKLVALAEQFKATSPNGSGLEQPSDFHGVVYEI